MIIKTDKYTYTGGWQVGAAHLEKLEGPIDHGVIEYANGDRFEGSFQLPYMSIDGEAFTAKGEFRFADGSVIEQAWIVNTNNGGGSLEGLYRIKHPNGPDTITPFSHHKRHGLEIVLVEKPYAIEWKMGEQTQELEVESYTFKTLEYDDLTELTIVFADGTTVIENGGQLVTHSTYGTRHFKPNLRLSIQYGSQVDLLLSTYHEMERDVTLPDPMNKLGAFNFTGQPSYLSAKVQGKTGHVYYCNVGVPDFHYDGELKDCRPHGHGILTLNNGGRYEGEFKDGLCHGKGVYTNESAGVIMDGRWIEGEFQDPDGPEKPIYLHISDGNKTIVAKPGYLYLKDWLFVRIERVEKDKIVIGDYRQFDYITPDHPFHDTRIEYGRELSDGTPLEDDIEYHLTISWVD